MTRLRIDLGLGREWYNGRSASLAEVHHTRRKDGQDSEGIQVSRAPLSSKSGRSQTSDKFK